MKFPNFVTRKALPDAVTSGRACIEHRESYDCLLSERTSSSRILPQDARIVHLVVATEDKLVEQFIQVVRRAVRDPGLDVGACCGEHVFGAAVFKTGHLFPPVLIQGPGPWASQLSL